PQARAAQGAVDRGDARLGARALRARRARARPGDGTADARAGREARGGPPQGGRQGERAARRPLMCHPRHTAVTRGPEERCGHRAGCAGTRLAFRTSGHHVDETPAPALPLEPLPAGVRRRRHLRGPAPPLGRGEPDPAPVVPFIGTGATLLLFKAKACGFLVILRRLGDQPFVDEALVMLATVYTFFSFIPWMT